MSVPGNEAPLPGHGRPEAGTSFFLATVQALASAGESLKSFNQLVHADNHSLLQLTDQLYASRWAPRLGCSMEPSHSAAQCPARQHSLSLHLDSTH